MQPARPTSPKRQRQRAAEQPGSGSTTISGQLAAQLKAASSPERVLQLVQQAGVVCDDVDLTTAVNRLVKLHQQDRHFTDRCRTAFQQLAQIALGQQLDPWAVTQFMWAAGKLWEGVAVKQPFGSQQAAWQQRMTAAFGDRSCKPQSVSNGLWAASKLGWQLEGSLAEAAEAALERLAARMDSQAVSNTLRAFANAGWLLGSRAAARLLQQLELLLPQANAFDVANSMWAMSKLGLPLSSSLKAALPRALQRTIPAANSQNLGNTPVGVRQATLEPWHWQPSGSSGSHASVACCWCCQTTGAQQLPVGPGRVAGTTGHQAAGRAARPAGDGC